LSNQFLILLLSSRAGPKKVVVETLFGSRFLVCFA